MPRTDLKGENRMITDYINNVMRYSLKRRSLRSGIEGTPTFKWAYFKKYLKRNWIYSTMFYSHIQSSWLTWSTSHSHWPSWVRFCLRCLQKFRFVSKASSVVLPWTEFPLSHSSSAPIRTTLIWDCELRRTLWAFDSPSASTNQQRRRGPWGQSHLNHLLQ